MCTPLFDLDPFQWTQRGVADITAIATADGWLYLGVLLDLFSRRVVGWAAQPTRDTSLVLTA